MAGYPGSPLAKKLGIKPGTVALVSHRPADVAVEQLLAPLPDKARLTFRKTRASPDLVICFAESATDLARRLPPALAAISTSGTVWVWWPKKSTARYRAGSRDLTEDTIRNLALELGVVDVKVCAVDETWSGLKLVYRLTDR